ncbi:hypothetical protein SPACI_024310 [Sporomusa acidovorans DSM 3132]|uniref:Uncharacterized protein n=1 Tax=Sporomusa acidovorans (strain ATCC 49682 / DSM 3132 / Mol) TaxID=1123286 RepID=A0ABZ3J1X2_SPOA4|nr:hypothetical protein [Sporomusa acidovorans]OZC24104.1 hypothetical protein SPACI_02510 [Sporomusa acidovorans DSM 3132]SDF69187.1 hypothetical protein SAMN04488499_106818 [Sporomusa acidovorans]
MDNHPPGRAKTGSVDYINRIKNHPAAVMVSKNFLDIMLFNEGSALNSTVSRFFSVLKKKKDIFVSALLIDFQRKPCKGGGMTVMAAFINKSLVCQPIAVGY